MRANWHAPYLSNGRAGVLFDAANLLPVHARSSHVSVCHRCEREVNAAHAGAHLRAKLQQLESGVRANRYGVHFIFKSMEQGSTFRITVPKYPTADPN
jgi:hypothetical protein